MTGLTEARKAVISRWHASGAHRNLENERNMEVIKDEDRAEVRRLIASISQGLRRVSHLFELLTKTTDEAMEIRDTNGVTTLHEYKPK